MLTKPSIIRVPTSDGPYGVGDSACNGYKKGKTSCKKSYTYKGKSGCIDTSYGGKCSWGLGISVVGAVVTVGGIAVAVT